MLLSTLISGGQTGVDRVALDWALARGIPHAGWCPAGRWAEDGCVPSGYRLRETTSADPAERTELNVRDSDGTVIFCVDPELTGGTALTASLARRQARPLLIVPRSWGVERAALAVERFVRGHRIKRLNVAGPRLSEDPRAADWARQVLEALSASE